MVLLLLAAVDAAWQRTTASSRAESRRLDDHPQSRQHWTLHIRHCCWLTLKIDEHQNHPKKPEKKTAYISGTVLYGGFH
jgi:hypothetical protein